MMHDKVLGFVLAAAPVVAIGLAAPAQAQFPDELDYSVPAQDLALSLREVSVRSGVNVIAPHELVAGRRAPAVSGRFTAEGIVRALLTGSGLQVRRIGGSLVIASGAPDRNLGGGSEDSLPATRDDADIVVTGTHLREAPRTSPTIVITREDVERSGASSVEQLMRKVPQNFQGGINQENFGVSGAGADITEHGAGINLRGLGQRATLVLVNGRRVAPSGAGSFVDVSLIPITAIERVEIVTDGASAIYGSDAVGGVVNFILRERFEGLETSLQAGTTTGGGGEQLVAGATAGQGWSTGRAMLSYEYRREDEIRARHRGFTINLPPDRFLLPKERRHSLFGVFGQALTPGLKLEITASHADRRTERTYFVTGTALPVNALAQARSTGLTGSLSHSIGDSWTVELSGGYFVSRTRQEQDQPGGLGLVNRLFTRNALHDLDLQVDGTLADLPGGPLKVALGGQVRREDYRDVFQTQVNAPIPRVGRREVKAAYAEVNVPIASPLNRRPGLERLLVSGAARYEDYDDLGSRLNPRFGLLWSPVSGLAFRGSYDTSFRAPLLSESTGFYNAFLLPAAVVFVDPRQASGVALALIGSNPDIRPERSRAWTFGAEFEPSFAPGLTLSLNYYAIRFSDRIGLPSPSIAVVGNSAFDPIINRSPTAQLVAPILAGAAQVIDVSGPGFTNGHAGPADVRTIVDDRITNTAVTRTRGVDLALRYDFTSRQSRFSVQLDANRILEFDDQLTSASPVSRSLNTPYRPIGWHARGGLAWSLGGWSANAFVNYAGPYRDNRGGASRTVESFTTLDAALAHDFGESGPSWLRGTRFAINVQNLLGVRPPRLLPDPGAASGLGYDPVNATGRGRLVSIQVRRSW